MQSVRFRRVLKDVRHVDREDYAMPVEETTVTRLAKSATYTDTCVYRATNILGPVGYVQKGLPTHWGYI